MNWPRKCARCGRAHSAADFNDLPLNERLLGDDVRKSVLDWPEEQVVEVRRCVCGALLAASQTTSTRMRPVPAPGPGRPPSGSDGREPMSALSSSR